MSDKKQPDAKAAPPKEPSQEPPKDDLTEAIRRISEGVTQLTSRGLNRRAIVTLLKDSTGVTKKNIEKVLNGLETLEADFTNRGAPGK